MSCIHFVISIESMLLWILWEYLKYKKFVSPILTESGLNGAGKTTLIKLLLRLYDPDEGRILLDGTDIREYDLDSYRAFFGVCFQDYKIFAASLSENVLMRRCGEADGALVEEALRFSGLEEFIEKKDRIMTKEFDEDGLVFSGGQRQKLSIARAYAKNASALILDEPTSALDPIAEDMIFQKLEELCKEKMVVFGTSSYSTNPLRHWILRANITLIS